jgi:flagellar protein FliO/FliZ
LGKNKLYNYRRIITVGIILGIALIGLVMINVDPVSADKKTINLDATGVTLNGDTTSTSAANSYFSQNATLSMFKMISALVVVLVCIYVCIYLLKKFMKRRTTAGGREGLLEVLETAYLGPRKTISLVRVADKSVLLGITENQINILTELGDEETSKIIAHEPGVKEESFNNVFKTVLTNLKKVKTGNKEAALDSR